MKLLPAISLDLWSVLLLLGCVHGVILALTLFLSRRRFAHSKVMLGALILILSYSLAISFLWQSELMIRLPHLVATTMPLLYLLGPLYWWLFRDLMSLPGRMHWIHFIPAVICLATIVPFYSEGLEFKLSYIASKDVSTVDLPATRAWYFGLLYLHLFLYWWYAGKALGDSFTNIDGRRTKGMQALKLWLRKFHFAFGGFLVVYLISFLILTVTPINYGEVRYFTQLAMALLVHLTGYLLLMESSLIKKHGNHSNGVWTSKLHLKDAIINLMHDEKPFLNQSLTLSEFSQQLGISPNKVSRVLNQEFQSNFSEFINKYRVEKAKQLLTSKEFDHYKVEAIGKEAGFKNKVNFNRVFKKYTGITPSRHKQILK